MKTSHYRIGVSILGTVTLAAGVTATVLLYLAFQTFYLNYHPGTSHLRVLELDSLRVRAPYFNFSWGAVPLLFPCLLSIVLAVKTTRLLTGFYTAFSVVGVLVTSVFTVIAIIYFRDLNVIHNSDCRQLPSNCECRRDATSVYQPIRFTSCGDLERLLRYGFGGCAGLAMAILMCLFGLVMSCRVCVTMDKRCRDVA